VLPWRNLLAGHARRARRRTDLSALELLEGRQLLSYSSLGYSLPQLRVTGAAGSVAAWGGTLDVAVTVQNTGASTIIEPLSLVPPAQVTVGPDGFNVPPYEIPSQADAPNSQVTIYLTPRPRTFQNAILVGTFTAPALTQNNITQFDAPIQLPQHPVGLPSAGVLYLRVVINANQSVLENGSAGSVSPPIPVRFVSRALPQLRVTALDLPTVMQPGDTIAPTFQITNFGSASTSAQGPVQVALVASTSPDFNLGSSIVALYTLPQSIPGQSNAPTRNSIRGHRRLFGSTTGNENVTPGLNVETFTGSPVTLPTSPSTYFVGIVVDPNNTLNQLSLPSNRLEQVRQVGPPVAGLPPAGVVSTSLTQQFPNPPDGVLIGTVNPGQF
jgi:hypothetical protein